MNKEKQALVESSGGNDKAARDSQRSRESSESKIIVALPCEICDELCPSDKLIEHQRECLKESETARRNVPTTTHHTLGTQEFVFNIHDSLPVHRTGYIEVQRGYSPTIEFEDDCIPNESAENDIASDYFTRGERSTVFFHPPGDPFVTRSGSDVSSATYIEIQRSYSPVMEFEEENATQVFSHNIPEFVHTLDPTSSLEYRHPPRFSQAENHFDHGRN